VNFFGNRDGLVHISELAPKRVAKVTDIVNEGDEVQVKVLEIDNRGKVRLSIKAVQAEEGGDAEKSED
jgi:polyribonucleotide nucleotidyltransferase